MLSEVSWGPFIRGLAGIVVLSVTIQLSLL
jgi:hypothetical protein